MSDIVIQVLSGELKTATEYEKQMFEKLYREQLEKGFYVVSKNGSVFWSNKHKEKAIKQLEKLSIVVENIFERS